MGSIDDYTFRTFPAAAPVEGAEGAEGAVGAVEPDTAAWIQAERRGFHDSRANDAALARTAANLATDGRQLAGAYLRASTAAGATSTAAAPTSTAADASGTPTSTPALPVATFASFTGTLNVGTSDLLPTHLISNVTVRPTHRRNGLLRRMMTENLAAAAAAGFPVAALTVSEATIYRRFGFGVATWVSHTSVRTDERFRMLGEPRGRCELIEAAELRTLGPQIFAAFHAAHPGSVDRHAATWARISGGATEKDDENRSIYAAVHYDETGAADGYVSYLFRGWDTDPQTLEVVDLVAADDNAYLGLWNFLASVDLIDRVEFPVAPADDPLRWALTNWRAVAVTGLEDWLWLRILDVVAAFEARAYVGTGSIVLRVTDALGYASGTYSLRVADALATAPGVAGAGAEVPSGVAGARAVVTRDDAAAPDVTLDAPALGSLYLGGVDPVTLAAAGQLAEHTPGAALRLRALLAPVAPVYGTTHF